MDTDFIGYSKDVITDSRRLEIFFRPNGIAHQYVKNINVISEQSEKIGKEYKSWLLAVEVPKIRDRILEAIENDFLKGTLDKNCYKCKMELHNELFNMYEKMIDETATEREFLVAYI